ncbi:MAG: ATP-binding cassette domain-containing protein, partial [Chloroflexi bacterium]|nr:ATP-binding cassette domain-containing protein [Chloroflexota bacterium]
MPQSATILEAKQLSKSHGSIMALEDATIRFENKKIYGLLGRNGAGKTTLLDILSNRIFADSGSVTCYGEDIAQRP